MTNLKKFLDGLGNLHDCAITHLEWKRSERAILLEIEDLYFNFLGLPEYPGAKSGRILFQGVKYLQIDLCETEGLSRVDDFIVENRNDLEYFADVKFWPSGRMKIFFRAAIVPNVKLP